MPLFIYVYIFIFGLIIGSFLNCLVWRLHTKEGMWNRSYCPKCKKQIAWYDNLPVLSFIALGGKCRHCKKSISWQYPAVELAAGGLFLAAFMKIFPDSMVLTFSALDFLQLFKFWFLISIMIIVFIYDLRWFLILDIITLPAAFIIFIMNVLLGFSWLNLVISGIIGGGFFLVQFVISKGKWIGGGDIRLGLLMGLALGWPNIAVSIMFAYFAGSVAGISLIVGKKKKWGSEIPLGVFLSLATVITLFWGDQILTWYLSIF